MNLGSCLKVAIQLIERLRDVHNLGYIHRDLKPENICVGLDTHCTSVYLIDFGLAKSYLDTKGNHITIKEKNGLVGTIRYTSVNSHLSLEQSRRDDLESLAYILIYMIKGKLPWQGLVVFDDETRMRKISEMKCAITPEKLTEGLSPKLAIFFRYIKKLKFHETPDYSHLIRLLNEVAEERDIVLDDHNFEWAIHRASSIRSNSKSLINTGPEIGKKSGDSSPTDPPYQGQKLKLSTVANFLEIPQAAISPKPDSDLNAGGGFNSRMVKVDSYSAITSGEELVLINNFEEKEKSKTNGSQLKPKTSLSAQDVRLTTKDDEDNHSENYSQVMDENISNIGKKIEMATLTPSKLIGDINRTIRTKGMRRKPSH